MLELDEHARRLKRAAEAMEALADVVRHADLETYEVRCIVAEDLAKAMSAFAAWHLVPGRPGLAEAWQGPGHYEMCLESGLSQSQDWDKLDDAVVLVRKTGELPG